ncbi:putative RNA-directed DNA polymerase [Lupinus albus]|uniref:Putative RNA-directed DNA polymerase n=1 Tax=Lupinus albus TaxID=3870 RepID=A0A6A4PVC4_LUPAL|nr:putative RNA-directed DNA polymerase [Lupinus albus]
MEDGHIVEKILCALSDKYNYIVCSIEESKDINEMTVDELYSSLLVHEHKIKRKEVIEQALKVTGDRSALRSSERFGDRGRWCGGYRGRGRGRSFNKSTIECYRCHKLGHFQYECPTYTNYAEHVELDEG